MSGDDVLSRVLLTPSAVARWRDLASSPEVAPLIGALATAEIPDELARVEADGSLTIFVTLPEPHGELSMRIEPSEWRWMDHRVNH